MRTTLGKLLEPYRYLVPILLLSTWPQAACQNQGTKSRSADFDWNSDLAPLDTKPNTQVIFPWKTRPFDSTFCKDRRPGSCLSLIIRVPKADLVQDIGLSSLALASSSANMRARLDEACQAAWGEYRTQYLFDPLRPIRSSLVRSVEKMRCIFLFMSEELASENAALANNEIGISVRLTKFDLTGTESGADIRQVGIQLKSTEVRTEFRSVAFFSGKELSNDAPGWELAAGMGVENQSIKATLGRDIQWKVDFAALSKNLEKIATDAPGMQEEISSFFTQAKSNVDQIISLKQALNPSIALVGMGYNAYRSLCGENRDLCKSYQTRTNINNDVNKDLEDLIPSSETNEVFRLAVIRSIQGILDQTLAQSEGEQIKRKFQISK